MPSRPSADRLCYANLDRGGAFPTANNTSEVPSHGQDYTGSMLLLKRSMSCCRPLLVMEISQLFGLKITLLPAPFAPDCLC